MELIKRMTHYIIFDLMVTYNGKAHLSCRGKGNLVYILKPDCIRKKEKLKQSSVLIFTVQVILKRCSRFAIDNFFKDKLNIWRYEPNVHNASNVDIQL